MYFPDYKGGSIVNLMSSIARACKGKTSYEPLKIMPQEELKKYKNIALVIVDALGYDYLIKKNKSFLFNNLKGKMTSVVLPTTSCAITTFLTGEPPQQTAITGWYMHLKEIGAVTTILPFVPRAKGNFNEEKIKISEIIQQKGFFEKIKRKSFVLSPEYINEGTFNKYLCKKAKLINTKDMRDFFRKLEKTIKEKGRKYVYAYWGDFDMLCHEKGKEDKKVERHFKKLDINFKKLSKRIKGTNTILLVTADHGSIFLPLNKRIFLDDHPKLKECLTLPMCGDAGVKYCYVHPSKAKEFEDYIRNNLSNICDVYKSQELIEKNLFGLGKPNPKLFDRLGDYILVMKNGNIIKETILGESDSKHLGHHGGLSEEEMLVPLIVLKA